ncbi:MAG TPA: hypothetical protein VF444_18555 [Pseudonocardiaceae bacterium]
MTRPADGGGRLEWHAELSGPPSSPELWIRLRLPGLVGLALLVAGIVGLFTFSTTLALILIFLGVLTIVLMLWVNGYPQLRVVAMWLEPVSDVPTFTVLRVNESTASYPVAAVTRVRINRSGRDPSRQRMHLWMGGHVEHTRWGPAAAAEPLLRMFEEAGAVVTTRVTDPD